MVNKLISKSSDIVNGHVKELLGLNVDLYSNRIKICKQCPLYKNTFIGEICNSKLWYNPITKDVSLNKKDGYVNGCGCRLRAKTTLINSKCPINKW